MELRHLRYFIAAAEEENISRAALKLHVSQPGISRQIRDLEEEIGFTLFQRTAKSLKLTEAGRAFLKEARTILQRTESAVKSARAIALGAHGELHIGYAPSLTARFLPQTIRAFQAVQPGVRAKLHDCSTEEMLAGLHDGKLQIAFTVRASRHLLRDFQFAALARDVLCVAVAPGHPFARKRAVTLSDTAAQPLISYNRKDYPDACNVMLSLFAGLKKRPRVAEEHDSVSSLIASVEAGNGVAIVARSIECTAGPRLKLLPITPAPEPIIIGAVWVAKNLTPAGEQFLKCARDTFHQPEFQNRITAKNAKISKKER
jgi:DNA-binding transcriptional LysR family regulator